MNFESWCAKHPAAAADLFAAFADEAAPPKGDHADKSEGWAQQQARFAAATGGKGVLWRNNVGATAHETHHRCPSCQFQYVEKVRPLRYGICNDTQAINEKFKSSDLIGIKQHLVTQQDVGRTLGLFWAVEVKAPGVAIRPDKDPHQRKQAAFGALCTRFGGVFEFSHGGVSS